MNAFIKERLLEGSSVSVWDPLPRLKLKTFTTYLPKTVLKIGEKVIKLTEERNLLGRFLVIQQARPTTVPPLSEAIGNYEMSVVVRSLCTNDGSLVIPKDKAILMSMISNSHGPVPEPDDLPTIRCSPKRVIIFDMLAILQSMTKTAAMKFLKDLLRGVCHKLRNMSKGCDEMRCMFDEYKDVDPDAPHPSLKDGTRQKRAGEKSKTPVSFCPHLNSKLIMSVSELLSSSQTK